MPIWLYSQPKKKHLDSRWTPENHLDSPRVHLEYVGQGKVLNKALKHIQDVMAHTWEPDMPATYTSSLLNFMVFCDQKNILEEDRAQGLVSPPHVLISAEWQEDFSDQC